MTSADDSLPPSGPTLTTALRLLVDTLESRSIRYAIIGGIATIQHGRVRTTNDIGVLLSVPQIGMPRMFDALRMAGFTADPLGNVVELRDDGLTSIQFDDVLIDIMRPVLPVYSHAIDRAVPMDILGQVVRISSVECLVVMKLIAFRPQDQADIQDLITAHRGQLDLAFITA